MPERISKALRAILRPFRPHPDQESAAAQAVQLDGLQRQINELSGVVRLLVDRQADNHRELRMLVGRLGMPPGVDWKKQNAHLVPAPADMAFPFTTLCRQESFETPYFPYWMNQLQQPKFYHRKLWEYAFICQALHERGMLQPGRQGVGFGVGSEPLCALFAGRGCRVTATDMDGSAAAEAGWVHTDQHAAGKEALRFPEICPDALFDANVEFRVCDMNAVPQDLTGYDFCWSACAFEHLGSIEHGLAYIERAMDCLKPGGFAVHTTEYNVTSFTDTVTEGDTVLFRASDIVELARRLEARGHIVAPLVLDPGDKPMDMYLDVPPYRAEPHVQVAWYGYGTTSLGLIVQKGENPG